MTPERRNRAAWPEPKLTLLDCQNERPRCDDSCAACAAAEPETRPYMRWSINVALALAAWALMLGAIWLALWLL